MMRPSLQEMLRNEATRKPAIAALLERVHDMTDAEIDAAAVPLGWYRKALRLIRDEPPRLSLADLEPFIASGRTPDPKGRIIRFNGPSPMVCRYAGSPDKKIEVDTGDLFFLPDSGGCWNAHIFSPQPIMLCYVETVQEGASRDEYLEMHERHLRNKHPTYQIIDLTTQSGTRASSAQTAMAKLGVRIG